MRGDIFRLTGAVGRTMSMLMFQNSGAISPLSPFKVGLPVKISFSLRSRCPSRLVFGCIRARVADHEEHTTEREDSAITFNRDSSIPALLLPSQALAYNLLGVASKLSLPRRYLCETCFHGSQQGRQEEPQFVAPRGKLNNSKLFVQKEHWCRIRARRSTFGRSSWRWRTPRR